MKPEADSVLNAAERKRVYELAGREKLTAAERAELRAYMARLRAGLLR